MTRTIAAFFIALCAFTPAYADDGANDLLAIQHEWAKIKYQTPDEDMQKDQIKALAANAEAVAGRHPGEAEYLVWQAIVLSTEAGIDGGLGALGKVKEARKLLEKAEEIDPDVLNGAVPTSLGSLYYQVPGWPIGFGSNKKARKYLEKAVALNPNGIDANFFYGDFLYERGDYDAARQVLERALKAEDRPDRPIADAGRREEIQALLAKIDAKGGTRSR